MRTNSFRIFAFGFEFLIEALIRGGHKGRLTGPWEDSFPPEDPDVSIEDIKMVLGTRRRTIDWNSMKQESQDRIIEEIIEDWWDARDDESERLYDAHMDR